MTVADQLLECAQVLSKSVNALSFKEPITHVYNPLDYAWEVHEQYIKTYANSTKKVLFMGMNPGPFGMAQTGIPFGEVKSVRDWIELGGWYECTDRESGWCTTKQTEFVSAYAHSKNPNEDMAESLSYFVVNPDALRSRSLAKYEFVRDRIMQGNIYISQIRDDLTFEVYNLYPEYVFPGKIKKVQVSLDGDPNEDKE